MSETEATPLPRRPMVLVNEQRMPDQPIPSPTPAAMAPPQLAQEFIERRAWRAAVIASLNVAASILAVRLILLISIAGAIVLAWAALAQPDPMRLGALGIYLAGAVLPVVWLSGRR